MTDKRPDNISKLFELLNPCRLCPHRCGANRLAGEKGRCRTAGEIRVSSSNLHFSEEPPVSGASGSGTIFFSNCTLSCVFCQNYPISRLGHGNAISVEELTGMMLGLQGRGAHNINFVTPTHYAAHLAQAVSGARDKGLKIPILYNSSGYDDVNTLRLLEGVIDVYMPDAKYSRDDNAVKYSGAENYTEVNRAALKEMHRQVGELKLDNRGIAQRGLIIRHLVLPGDIAGSRKVLEFIAKEISAKTYLSLMAQYHPADRAGGYPELSRKLTKKEYGEAVKAAEELGFENGWIQEMD